MSQKNPVVSTLPENYAGKAAIASAFIQALATRALKHGTRVNAHTVLLASNIMDTPRFHGEHDAILIIDTSNDRAVVTVAGADVLENGRVLATVVFDLSGITHTVNPRTSVNSGDLIQTIDEWTAHEIEFCETELADAENASEFMQNLVGGYLSDF
jgi:hypothetical protein